MPPSTFEQKPLNANHQRSWKILSCVLAVAILCVAGIAYFKWLANKTLLQQQAFINDFNQVDAKYHRAGDFGQSISALELLAKQEPNLSGSDNETYFMKIKLRLAANYIGRNQSGDRERAVGIYHAIIDEKTLSARSRGIALAEMASAIHWIAGPEEAKTLIFSQEPYAQILRNEGGDVHAAIGKLYEMSDALFPNALSRFQIAFMKATHLANISSMSTKEKELTAESILQYVKGGDELIATNAFTYENSYMAHMYYCRSMSLGAASRVLSSVSPTEVESSYVKAMTIAAARPDDFYSRSVGISARLNYAIFLDSKAGTMADRSTDIASLLSVYNSTSIVDPDFRLINSFMISVGKRENTDFLKSHALKLSDSSSNFKDYLRGLNWKVSN